MVVFPCEHCAGTGRVPGEQTENATEGSEPCPACRGRGYTTSADGVAFDEGEAIP